MYPKIRFIYLNNGIPEKREVMLDRFDVRNILGTSELWSQDGIYTIWRSPDGRRELVADGLGHREIEHFLNAPGSGREAFYGGEFIAGILAGLIRNRHHSKGFGS